MDINLIESPNPKEDPTQIEIKYPFVTSHSEYLQARVLLEIGSRSMMEPNEKREIASFVYQDFTNRDFADIPIQVFTVRPERTFLEKVFLLHEEFQKDTNLVRVNRMSRHLYDIEKLMYAGIAKSALEWKELYQNIVNHRKTMNRMSEVDYNLHQPQSISFIPPNNLLDAYKKDYQLMSEQMIYGEKLFWNDLLKHLRILEQEINSQQWNIEIKEC